MLGLGIGIHFGDQTGLQGGLLHLITHALMNGLAFMAVGVLAFSLHTRSPVIKDFRGMGWRFPFTALALTTALLSLGGIPPLAGFMSKLQILLPGLMSGSPLVIGLVIFAGVNSVLSLVYYLRIVNALFDTPTSDIDRARIPLPVQLPLAVLTVLLLVLGILPMLVTPMTEAVVRVFWLVGGG
jgi:NADH:ubiquinone oxidoreductase subunit 2 (subunit N)